MENKADRVRKRVVDLIHHSSTPHVGSALSCVEIVTSLYETTDRNKILKKENDRDRIVLSKGHAIATQLSALCEFGLLDWDVVFSTYCREGSVFFENTSPYTPLIEVATGSLGQGISYGVGVALGMRLLKNDESRAYIIVGDGELNEGQNWEGCIQASCFNLDNFVLIIDNNGLAGIDKTCSNMDLSAVLSGMGFATIMVDGHDYNAMTKLWEKIPLERNKPTAVICSTVKGKGISFMENNNDWHYRPISDNDYYRAKAELEKNEKSSI